MPKRCAGRADYDALSDVESEAARDLLGEVEPFVSAVIAEVDVDAAYADAA